METPAGQAVYRLRTQYRQVGRDAMPKGYKHTLEVLDDHSGQILATADVVGRPLFATLEVVDEQGRSWRMQPNRKFMPSRWIVTDPDQAIAMQFDQKILGKLSNPIYKCALAFLDGDGQELYRLIDPRSTPNRLFGVGPDDWVILDGERLAAKLVRLRREEAKSSGLRGVLRKLVTTADPGIASIGTEHLFPAPVALGMMIVFAAITDLS